MFFLTTIIYTTEEIPRGKVKKKQNNFKDKKTSPQELLSGGGLSRIAVLKARENEGFNILPSMMPKSIYTIILSIIKEPMLYLLIGCSLAYFIIGDLQEAVTLLLFLLFIMFISISQVAKAERALEELKNLSSPRAIVLRGGVKQRISAKELVTDDIIYINEGDRIPADAELLSYQSITLDESLFTGESLAIRKQIGEKLISGTTVTQGQGIAIVTAIGLQSEIAKIGKSIESTISLPTKLEYETRTLVKKVAWIASLICIMVGVFYTLLNNNWISGALVGLSLAMAILPNELPAVLTIFMALGAWRLAHKRVLTRKLSALENLGSITVLCVDKTGTLTLNQMSIQQIYSNGKSIDLNQHASNSLPEEFHETLEYGILASRKNPFDSMEIAFISAGEQYLKSTEHLHSTWEIEKEYPLTNKLLSVTYAWKSSDSGKFSIGAKGAPEAIIDLCHMPIEEAERIKKIAEEMANTGLRVLGIAKSFASSPLLPKEQHDYDFKFIGFTGIADPVRSDVPAAIAECYQAGIRIVIITGDHPATAKNIAAKIGLHNPQNIITGGLLEAMSEEELKNKINEINIFSRVSPYQKLRIVECLKSNGEIVAMTGDGVNDAPALKSSHIGIAMGKRGTDVARESSDIVLLEDDFASIVEAIRQGRRIYLNIKNAMEYLFAIHIPIMGISIIPVFLNMPLVLLPAHIAFLHLIIEPASSVAFEVDLASANIMNKPPRNPQHPLFDNELWIKSFLKGTSILLALVGVFVLSFKKGLGEREMRTLVFMTLIISNITLIILRKNSQKNNQNIIVKWLTFISIFMLLLVIYVPYFREIFHFSILNTIDIGICLIIGIASVAWVKLLPRINLKK